jgi:rhamnose utilization protein RhaD (predicted bifunctional aldolase and dehydrogenase)/NAD(P)-dependent dehydrogenase (short-subunit alcohol dehydrogenase family)
MKNLWSDTDAARALETYGPKWGEALALRTYTSRLLGAEPDLVLHGGGNTSVKCHHVNLFGDEVPAIYVKASGFDMASIGPEGHAGLALEGLRKLRRLAELTDAAMRDELHRQLLNPRSATPSVETLCHAFIPKTYIDHTHADAVLALTNQTEGRKWIEEALGQEAIVLDYVKPGFTLAKTASEAYDASPSSRCMVWMHHGIVTWGQSARESYEAMIEFVTKAEEFLRRRPSRPLRVQVSTPLATAEERLTKAAPIVRGLMMRSAGEPEPARFPVILRPLVTREVLDFVDSEQGRDLALTPPLTSDHLIRTKPWPLWVDQPAYEDPAKLRAQIAASLQDYGAAYDAYFERNATRLASGVSRFDSLPRVILMPGLGALCAGNTVRAADIARDITAHTLVVKAKVQSMGTYQGLAEHHLFDMEYWSFQHAKLGEKRDAPLEGRVGIITGAAGAIGSAIADELLFQGCHVALTDLPGEALENLYAELRGTYGNRVMATPLDVTDPASVAQGFEAVIRNWGGIDLVVVNAGLALAAGLTELSLEAFRKLERVNTEGSLLMLAEAGRHFKLQGAGGDIVLISTKNVFSPGAQFGAYSATKAAAHQLARIASLELAPLDVRVNMVAPDAVFSHGKRRSGLWAEVGPGRMRARGLDEAGLEEYYRNRNLLKARVTGSHVAKAVLFFATRQTPTTGATIPVDGGLPDATPR